MKSRADAPDYLRQQHATKGRGETFDDKARADHQRTDDDRQAAAVEIGDDAGRHFEQKAAYFQNGSDQHKLQRVEADRPHLIDHVDCEDHRRTDRAEQDKHDPRAIGLAQVKGVMVRIGVQVYSFS